MDDIIYINMIVKLSHKRGRMILNEKRKIELENQKNQRKEEVILAALDVFKKQGIENTKMTDISKKAQIGIASVYRYFKTKPDLVVEVACKFFEDETKELYKYYLNKDFIHKNGITKIQEILEVFLLLYREHKYFIRFIDEFDRYIVNENITKEKLSIYERGIIELKPVFLNAFKCGNEDGTIRTDLDSEQFYFSITHVLMSLCQKLTLRGDILESNHYVNNEEQIKMIIEMAIKYIN